MEPPPPQPTEADDIWRETAHGFIYRRDDPRGAKTAEEAERLHQNNLERDNPRPNMIDRREFNVANFAWGMCGPRFAEWDIQRVLDLDRSPQSVEIILKRIQKFYEELTRWENWLLTRWGYVSQSELMSHQDMLQYDQSKKTDFFPEGVTGADIYAEYGSDGIGPDSDTDGDSEKE